MFAGRIQMRRRASQSAVIHECDKALRYPEPEPGVGAGLSGAPPTETGPTGFGNGGGSAGVTFRDVRSTRARGFGRGMLDVVNGVIAPWRVSTCVESAES
jgi:hypothetical protein